MGGIRGLLCLLAAVVLFPARATCASQANQEPYVVLVSLDGFRHDYARVYDAQTLLKLGRSGALADGLIPVFPSVTATAHYSLATGVYPDRHGIVDNSFYDPQRNEDFRFAKQGGDGYWYRADPLWITAEKQGVRTALYSWPASAAAIQGRRATYYRAYTDRGTNQEAITQVLEWLRLPAAQRPRFIALYFADVDTVAHRSGAEGPELRPAVHELDQLLGRLWTETQRLPLRVNLIVVSDHGMITRTSVVPLRDFTDLTQARPTQGGGALVHLYTKDRAVQEKLFRDLKNKSSDFAVYRRGKTPKSWHYSQDPRIGDLIVVARKPVALDGRPVVAKGGAPFSPNPGLHGLAADDFPEMNGFFAATGPNIKSGVRIKAFEAVHVYPLIAKILGLTIPPGIDGRLSVLRSIYQP